MYQKYRPDIDGLRALAILPVILFHADLGCTGGFVGVDIFFVISGFLITTIIFKELNDGTFGLTAFWERRIRRILPALAIMVLATLLAGFIWFLPGDFELMGKSVIAQSILLSNVFFYRQGLSGDGYFATVSDTKILLHTWSLAVEEQFYVLFPLLLIFLARNKRFSIAQTILWLGASSFVLAVVGSYYWPGATFYLLPARAWELMLGAFLAVVHGRQVVHSRMNEFLGWSGLSLIFYSIFFYTRNTRFPGLTAIPPCLGAALIIFSGSGVKSTSISRVLAFKPVVFFGLISYSLYLWHWPLLVISKYYNYYHYGTKTQSWQLRAALLLLSIGLAAASLKWVESPFRKRLICPRRSQIFSLAGGTMLTLTIIGGGVYFNHGIPARMTAKADIFFYSKYDIAFRNDMTPQQAAAGQFAELGAQSTNQPIEIILWGDSHAMSVAPALDELCRRFSVRGIEATHSATAPILGYFKQDRFGLSENSLNFSESVVEFITRRHIKKVIIAARWSHYGPPDVAGARLIETVQRIMASGASVYVLKDVPEPGFDVPLRAGLLIQQNGDLTQLEVTPDKDGVLNNDYEPMFNHLSKIGATILDTPKFFLNSNGRFDIIRNDKVLYSDEQHLTVAGSKLLLPMFEPLFHN
jgi:peptidoglycan/LPS O-acetylase OafA/YrhL